MRARVDVFDSGVEGFFPNYGDFLITGGTSIVNIGTGPISVTSADTGRWTVGPTAEVKIYRRFSLELDALYRSYRNTSVFVFSGPLTPGGDTVQFESAAKNETHVWDLPVLLKYRFTAGRWRPFLDAGYQWSFSSSDVRSNLTCLSGPNTCSGVPLPFGPSSGTTSTDVARGPAAGAGVEIKVGKFKLAPEVRYTHLSNAPNANQVTVLAGFTF